MSDGDLDDLVFETFDEDSDDADSDLDNVNLNDEDLVEELTQPDTQSMTDFDMSQLSATGDSLGSSWKDSQTLDGSSLSMTDVAMSSDPSASRIGARSSVPTAAIGSASGSSGEGSADLTTASSVAASAAAAKDSRTLDSVSKSTGINGSGVPSSAAFSGSAAGSGSGRRGSDGSTTGRSTHGVRSQPSSPHDSHHDHDHHHPHSHHPHSPRDSASMSAAALDEPYDLHRLPKHACAYCGIHDPKCVVRCDHCKRWFCNGRGKTSGAHIVNHLVRSKHKKVSLHKDSLVGNTSLECYMCGVRNIWVLGFVAATKEDLVVILCRDTCANATKLKNLEWNAKNWQPLIRDRQFLEWMVQVPGNDQLFRSRPMTMPELVKLEELWKHNPKADLLEVDESVRHETYVRPVQLTYDSAEDYESVYRPLVDLEADYDRKVKEALKVTDINVKWDRSISGSSVMKFILPRARLDYEMKIAIGDEMMMANMVHPDLKEYTADGLRWQAVGTVTGNDESSGELTVLLRELVPKVVSNVNSGFCMQFVWKPTTFKRMKSAMISLIERRMSVTGYLFHLLMGHEVVPHEFDCEIPTTLSVRGLPELNHSQMAAVKHCLKQPLSLIQGPPGTGKTVTSATIVWHLVQKQEGQVLVTAPSNIAVDHLTQKIEKTGLKVVRVMARSRETVTSSIEKLHLHKLVIELASLTKSELWKYHQLKQEMGELRSRDQKKYDALFTQTAQRLLDNADVVCCTCAGAGSPMLRGRSFRQVLIDESTQATEPECLIPLVKGAKQVVLVGDHCQLGPVIMCKKAASAGLQRSLFERLVLLNLKPVRLQVQYRMHPCLSSFSSNCFYEGTLQNGVTKEERTLDIVRDFFPNPEAPMFFYCTFGREEFAASGTSFLNRTEAQCVEKCVTKLLKLGVKPEQIGIVTPYEGQRQYVVSFMRNSGVLDTELYEMIEVASVDSFQGREKDFIILSCVRSNTHHGIGFLNDPRRLNVAATRAKYGFVVVGNPTLLSRQILWHNLLNHFKSYGLLVEGNLDSLKQSTMTLSKPRKFYSKKMTMMMSEQRGSDHHHPPHPHHYAGGTGVGSGSSVYSSSNPANWHRDSYMFDRDDPYGKSLTRNPYFAAHNNSSHAGRFAGDDSSSVISGGSTSTTTTTSSSTTTSTTTTTGVAAAMGATKAQLRPPPGFAAVPSRGTHVPSSSVTGSSSSSMVGSLSSSVVPPPSAGSRSVAAHHGARAAAAAAGGLFGGVPYGMGDPRMLGMRTPFGTNPFFPTPNPFSSLVNPLAGSAFGTGLMSSAAMLSSPSLSDGLSGGLRRDFGRTRSSTDSSSQDDLHSQSQSLATQEETFDSLADDFSSLRTS